jgi:hypothetical protein
LALACRLFGILFKMFAVLCTPAALLASRRPHLAEGFPEPERAIGDGNPRRRFQPATLRNPAKKRAMRR